MASPQKSAACMEDPGGNYQSVTQSRISGDDSSSMAVGYANVEETPYEICQDLPEPDPDYDDVFFGQHEEPLYDTVPAEQGDAFPDYIYVDMPSIHSNPGWFYETIDRAASVELLKKYGEDGSFLVRLNNTTGEFILSVRWDTEVYHSEIKKEDNTFSLPGYPKFQSLHELIGYLTNHDSQLMLAGVGVIIRSPLSKTDIPGIPTVQNPSAQIPPRVPPRPGIRTEPGEDAESYISLRASPTSPQSEGMYATVQAEEYWTPEKSGAFTNDLPLWQEFEQMFPGPKQPGSSKQAPSVISSASSTTFVCEIRQNRNWLSHMKNKTRENRPELDEKTARIQECLFSFLTGEAIFSGTLAIIKRVHMEKLDPSKENSANLNDKEFYNLFSNIVAVRKVSNRLIVMLEKEWKQSDTLSPKRIGDFVAEYASRYFVEYVKYAGNYRYQLMQHKQLKTKNRKYTSTLKTLQEHYKCKGHDLMSFLAAPWQHVMKLPLYFKALEKCMDMSIEGFEEIQTCKEVLTDTVRKCDAKVLELDDIEQLAKLSDCIEFGQQRKVPLVSTSRFLVKEGIVTHNSAAAKKKSLTLMLFNDLLLILKKKGAKYHLVDHCDRQSSHVEIINPEDDYPEQSPQSTLIIDFESAWARFESNHNRPLWASAGCKQVAVVRPYTATDVDELTLDVGDVIKVNQEKNDWIKGERLRDSRKGWFPAKSVEEIKNPSDHIANLREQQRILQQTIDTMAETLHLKEKP